jgi:hypothetical protein
LHNVVSSVDRNAVNMCEWNKTDSARPWDGFSPSVRWFWPACFFRDLGHPLSRVKPRGADLIRLQEHHFRSIIASDGGPVDRRITYWFENEWKHQRTYWVSRRSYAASGVAMTAGVYLRDGRALVGSEQFHMLFADTTSSEGALAQTFFSFPTYNSGWGCPDIQERGRGCALKLHRVVACVSHASYIGPDWCCGD